VSSVPGIGPAEQEANMAKKQKPEAAPEAESPSPTTPIANAAEPKRRNAKRPEPTRALADIFAGYLTSLDERGSSSGTIASYRMELDLAAKALGADTAVSALTDAQVAAFFESDPVTRKRNGKPKSPLSIDKTRRVLRQALVWAGHADLVPTAEVAS
jgi:hypothetical protein